MEPVDWSVVVVGRWNRAILTPSGIGSRVFQLETGTPLDVQVAIDGLAPTRVRHDGCIVTVSGTKLIVDAEDPVDSTLNKCCKLAINAMQSLPETPLTAAGVNIKYADDEPDDSLLDLMQSNIDQSIADSGRNIVERVANRTIQFRDGVLNLAVILDEDFTPRVEFNFHRASSELNSLHAWLNNSVNEFVCEARAIMADVLKIKA